MTLEPERTNSIRALRVVGDIHNHRLRHQQVRSVRKEEGLCQKGHTGLVGVKENNPDQSLESLRVHAINLGISHQTVQRAIKKVGGKGLARVERPLSTPAMKAGLSSIARLFSMSILSSIKTLIIMKNTFFISFINPTFNLMILVRVKNDSER
uniref:Uncharacterized protein n=1 Tax=Lepeophtheirus salmonis TaxID=72036 RepID=A0A0K2TVR4_LEPSM